MEVDPLLRTKPNSAQARERAAHYVGLKLWGWYLSQFDDWMRHVHTGRPVRILEVGAFDGVSANLMLDLVFPHPASELVAIDPFLPDPTTPEVGLETRSHFNENVARGGHESQITLIESLSFPALKLMGPHQFDFIYIDGSHLARHVLEDAVLSFPLLKPGGVLGFDDYLWGAGCEPRQTPRPAVDAFEAIYGPRLQLLFSNAQRFFRKTTD